MNVKIKFMDISLMIFWLLEGIPLLRLPGGLSNLFLLWGAFYILAFTVIHSFRKRVTSNQKYLFGVILGIHLLSSAVSCTLFWVYEMSVGLLLPLTKAPLLHLFYKWEEVGQE
ncbi:hypothetical protein ACTQ4E_15880 [Lawsonibacter sp. LCP25S3_G6]|uniref:hypothetical protein n=1 Tax=unclassified Lawsonibacter TaxID=2617946 RepID=UPI003F943A2A